jgi:hypothetical protein
MPSPHRRHRPGAIEQTDDVLPDQLKSRTFKMSTLSRTLRNLMRIGPKVRAIGPIVFELALTLTAVQEYGHQMQVCRDPRQ